MDRDDYLREERRHEYLRDERRREDQGAPILEKSEQLAVCSRMVIRGQENLVPTPNETARGGRKLWTTAITGVE